MSTLGVTLCVHGSPGRVHADPLRLRGDAYGEAHDPSGLLVLQGEDQFKPWLSSEALVWLGAHGEGAIGVRPGDSSTTTGDVLTVTVRARDPEGRGEASLGRFVTSMGAIRPHHIDGASVLGRAPTGTTLSAFGGAPVVPRFGERAYDWVVGGRLGQSVADRVSLGASYVQERDRGMVADEEIGADVAASPWRRFDLAARTAYDLTSPGLADALASAALRLSSSRVEVFGTRRSPSRILPATSLFSVFGDVPSTRLGTSVSWRVAPRLDLSGVSGVTIIDEHVGYDATARATLRTADEGAGQVGLELRRQGVPSASWSGVRTIAVIPVRTTVRTAMEFELVRPDASRGRGDLWPWGLVSVGWRAVPAWDFAGAVEAGATPTTRREVTALARVSYTWEKP
jgi:hypothetical protein